MTPDVTRASTVPSIPSVLGVTDQNTRRALDAVRSWVNLRDGNGDPLDGFVTFRDLLTAGVANVILPTGSVSVAQNGNHPLLQGVGVTPGVLDYSVPPAVAGLTASAALNCIIVSFTTPSYYNHAYTEIWRSSTNNLGAAVKIGDVQVGGSVYVDAVGNTNTSYYYWARNVSTSDVDGPYNATNGTLATTGLVLGSNIAANTITASNIAAATITGSQIAANTITASNLSVSTLSAITANMGSITAGNITLNTSGYIAAGQTAYNTGTGFWLGYSSGNYVFSLGNPSGNNLTWNGSALAINGAIVGTSNIQSSAVTNTQHAFTAGSQAITSWTTVQSVSITTTGGPVLLVASFTSTNTDATSEQVNGQILNGSTGLITQSAWCTASQAVSVSVVYVDNPAAGTYTYNLQAETLKGGGSGTANVTNASLVAIELKR